MAKVTGPFLSLGATGSIGKTLIMQKWKGIQVVRQFTMPKNPRTPAQVANRDKVADAVYFWRTQVTPAGQTDQWNKLSTYQQDIGSGYNIAIRAALHAYSHDTNPALSCKTTTLVNKWVFFWPFNLASRNKTLQPVWYCISYGPTPQCDQVRAAVQAYAALPGEPRIATRSTYPSGTFLYFRLFRASDAPPHTPDFEDPRSGIHGITPA